MPRTYRAFVRRGGVADAGALLHLIGDKAEATLCGLPRSALDRDERVGAGGVVCRECVEWIRRRNTGTFSTVPRNVST